MNASNCLDEDALFALVDEPDGASAAAIHVAGCVSCAANKRAIEELLTDMREPVRTFPAEAFVGRLEAKMRAATKPRRTLSRSLGAAAATLLAIAAGLVLIPRFLGGEESRTPRLRGDETSRAFAARGPSTEMRMMNKVELSLDAVTRTDGQRAQVTPARADMVTRRDARLLVSYGTRGLSVSAFLLCFAVDTKGEVHWLYPAYESPTTDPAAVELLRDHSLGPMATEAVLDEIAPGLVRVYALVSNGPRHVSDIERLAASELERAKLEARFSDADLRSWEITLGDADGGSRR